MKILIQNKKIGLDWRILETFQAGIELQGFEVKSLKNNHGSLASAQAIFSKGELWLIGVDIPPYQPNNAPPGYENQRNRRLLLNRKELNYLSGKLNEKGLHLIPSKIYLKDNLIKVELALCRRKQKTDRREDIKKEISRREMRNFKI
jgi:SsrA-binding protein